MIPVKLKIKGFLTFKNETQIDFEKVYEDGLFLISGPTGSGKTTIFDAICYALYGLGSSSKRKSVRELKSEFLRPDEEMSVEFTFISNETKYMIIRKRKDDNRPESAILQNLDNPEEAAVSGSTKVTNKSSELIGLDFEQFNKVVMLPQGEFSNFLISPTKSKEEILSKIFNTGKYQKITNEIIIRKKQIDEQLKSFKTVIDNQKLQYEFLNGVEEYTEIIEVLDLKVKETLDIIVELQRIRTKAEDEFNRVILELKETEKNNYNVLTYNSQKDKFNQLKLEEYKIRELEDKNRILRIVKENVRLEENYRNEQMELNSLHGEVKVLTDEIEQNKIKLEELRNKNREIPDIEKRIVDLYKEKDKLEKNFSDLKKLETLTNTEKLLSQRLNQIKEAEEDHRKLEETISLNSSKYEKLINESHEINDKVNRIFKISTELESKQKDIDTAIKLYEEILKLEEAEKLTLSELEKLKNMSIMEDNRLKTLKNEYDKLGLSKYVKDIKDGEPCPLCGSVHHPSIFKADQHISSEMVDEAEKKYRTFQIEIAKLEGRRLSLKDKTTENSKALEEYLSKYEISKFMLHDVSIKIEEELLISKKKEKELKDRASIKEDEIIEIKKNLSEDKIQDEKLKDILSEKDAVNSSHIRTLTEIYSIRENIESEDINLLEERRKAVSKELKSLLEKKSEIINNLRVFEKIDAESSEKLKLKKERIARVDDELRKDKEEFQSLIDEIQITEDIFVEFKKDLKSIDSNEKRIMDYKDELKSLENSIETYERLLKTTEIIPTDKLEIAAESLKNEIEKTDLELDQKKNLKTNYSLSLDNIREQVRLTSELQDEKDAVYSLSRVSNEGINFNNYVLAYFLDGILINANKKLDSMTSSRYSLERNEEQKRSNSKFGLDLLVFDSYTGKSRDVTTMSGGELFKASLAMALGMSEFIQEKNNIRNLEALFIDEGFGTLDPESLDHAMEVLMDLKDNGRKIGIISHVEELKTRIPHKILVESNGPEGSSVRVI